ncbi:MAG: quinone oxidoreductase, partial [Hyphomicrobiales bacterium]|nr:quinone oxidoreductase [Hyphomicrobiales bacterium]
MNSHAIVMQTQGKPEVMVLEEVEIGAPASGQAVVRQTAVGVNYLDVYHRAGVYPLPLPSRI